MESVVTDLEKKSKLIILIKRKKGTPFSLKKYKLKKLSYERFSVFFFVKTDILLLLKKRKAIALE